MDALEPAHCAVAGRGVAASLLANVSSLADDMLRYLVERIPEVGGDVELRGLTLGSCSSNLEAALSMFRHGIDVAAAEAPVTALEHARAMASRGHSVDVMLRFYRLGHEYFTEKLSDSLTDWIDDPTVALRTFIDLERFGFRYIDRISSLVAAEYVAELDRRQNQARAERDDVVRALLAGLGPNVSICPTRVTSSVSAPPPSGDSLLQPLLTPSRPENETAGNYSTFEVGQRGRYPVTPVTRATVEAIFVVTGWWWQRG